MTPTATIHVCDACGTPAQGPRCQRRDLWCYDFQTLRVEVEIRPVEDWAREALQRAQARSAKGVWPYGPHPTGRP